MSMTVSGSPTFPAVQVSAGAPTPGPQTTSAATLDIVALSMAAQSTMTTTMLVPAEQAAAAATNAAAMSLATDLTA